MSIASIKVCDIPDQSITLGTSSQGQVPLTLFPGRFHDLHKGDAATLPDYQFQNDLRHLSAVMPNRCHRAGEMAPEVGRFFDRVFSLAKRKQQKRSRLAFDRDFALSPSIPVAVYY